MRTTKKTQIAGRLAGTAISVALLTFVLYRVFPSNSTTAALIFMMLILCISTVWGLTESLVAAFAAALSLSYYFLPPVGFSISSGADWVAFITFVISAFVTSQLASRMREKTRESIERQDETERLYALSRSFMLTPDGPDIPPMIARQLTETFGFQGVALYYLPEDHVYRSGRVEIALSIDAMREYARPTPRRQAATPGMNVMAMAQDGNSLGALALVGGAASATALHAIANLAAITLLRGGMKDARAGDLISK